MSVPEQDIVYDPHGPAQGPPALTAEEWRDPQIKNLVAQSRKWQAGNEVTVKTALPFIYNILKYSYIFLTDYHGAERGRVILAIVLHSLETKPDWPDDDTKQMVTRVVLEMGTVALMHGNVNIKEKAMNMIRTGREFVEECGVACGCIPALDI
jgi:hypothetical protein